MKEKTSKVGGMLEKTGIKEEVKVLFPETLAEVPKFLGKKKIGKAEVEISEATFLQYAWRGFTLSFQGEGEVLSEEEKGKRKASRKADNAEIAKCRARAKELGISLAEFIRKYQPVA